MAAHVTGAPNPPLLSLKERKLHFWRESNKKLKRFTNKTLQECKSAKTSEWWTLGVRRTFEGSTHVNSHDHCHCHAYEVDWIASKTACARSNSSSWNHLDDQTSKAPSRVQDGMKAKERGHLRLIYLTCISTKIRHAPTYLSDIYFCKDKTRSGLFIWHWVEAVSGRCNSTRLHFAPLSAILTHLKVQQMGHTKQIYVQLCVAKFVLWEKGLYDCIYGECLQKMEGGKKMRWGKILDRGVGADAVGKALLWRK